MVIRNKIIAKIICKILDLKPLKLEFVFKRELYDPEVTKLAFLNQSLAKFDSQVKEFRNGIQEAIKEECKPKKKDS